MKAALLRGGLAVLLLALLAVFGGRAWKQTQHGLELAAICEAAQAQQWQQAVDLGAESLGQDPDSLIAAECRCVALHALGQQTQCRDLLDRLLSSEATGSWLPGASLSLDVVAGRREQGRTTAAAQLAHRAALVYPNNLPLRLLELELRSDSEEPRAVLDELWTRAPSEEQPLAAFRLFVADRYRRLGLAPRALTVLGEQPADGNSEQRFAWFEQKARAEGQLGRIEDLGHTIEAAIVAGHSATASRALQALILEKEGLSGPGADPTALLLEAVSRLDEIEDPWLREAVLRRVIMGMVVAGRPDEALRLYDRGREEFPLEGLSRAEIERESLGPGAGPSRGVADGGTLSFQVPGDQAGSSIRISPAAGQPIDSSWDELALSDDGRLRVRRSTDYVPSRWVLRNRDGRVTASGAVWPRAGTETPVTIAPRTPAAASTFLARQEPGDGRRRVFVILPDCGDWRLVQYLRERGDLPVLDHLVHSGTRGVLVSKPPFTAAAMRSLVHPHSQGRVGMFSVLYALGEELKGLSSVTTNPAGALAWLLPEEEDLFASIGAGSRQAANLLFAHGALSGGANAVITGPAGAQRQLGNLRVQRPLSTVEKQRHPALAAIAEDRRELVERIAAELDTATTLAGDGEVDLLLLRIEALDLITHGFYSELAESRQDDGEGVLASAYRYLDERLGELHAALDQDDVLIVLSDHGIRTAMQHDVHALFVMAGGGIPVGRSPGTPDFRGVPLLLAKLLSLDVTWQDTGVGKVE